MLEQLQSIHLPVCKYVRLRFRYRIDGSLVKIFTLLTTIDIQHAGQASVYDLLMSIKENVIMRFLMIQHECVSWESVSITYPSSRFGTKQDILKLPLVDFKGLNKNPNIDPFELSVLYISLRFPGRPLPKQVKIHGVYNDESPDLEALSQNSANAYIERFSIQGKGVTYSLLFTTQVTDKGTSQKKGNTPAKNKKAMSSKTIKKSTQFIEAKMCFWRIGR